MKMNTRNVKTKKGMTLLELTVVILVLLSLISVLFIGARAWKKGSDRAACILNIRNMHQAVRGHQNMTAKTTADTIDWTLIIGTNGYLDQTPVCPSGGNYTDRDTNFPGDSVTEAVVRCSLADTLEHVPSSVSGW